MSIKLDSANRSSGSISDFRLTLAEPLSGRYRLTAFYGSNSYYNISSANNKVYFTDSIAREATLPPGFYDSMNIAAAVQTAMNAVSTGYTVSYSSTTGCLTVANAIAFYFTFANTTNSAGTVLGFTTSAAATSQTGSLVNMASVRSLNVLIDGCVAVSNPGTSSNNGWTFVVPITENSLNVLAWEPQHPPCFELSSSRQPRIQVVNDQNQPIVLQQDWYILLEQQ